MQQENTNPEEIHPLESGVEALIIQNEDIKSTLEESNLLLQSIALDSNNNDLERSLELQMMQTADNHKETLTALKELQPALSEAILSIPQPDTPDFSETNSLLSTMIEEIKKKEDIEIEIDDETRSRLRGDKGDTGDRGPIGPIGKTGKSGLNGLDGADGRDGISPTLEKVTEKVVKEIKKNNKDKESKLKLNVKDLEGGKEIIREVGNIFAQTYNEYDLNGVLLANGPRVDLKSGTGITITGRQLSNGAEYTITSDASEADTLQSVTDRGATTTNNITANAVITPTVYTDTISSLFGNPGLSISNKALYDGISTSLSWQNRTTYDTNGVPSTNWENRQLLDTSGIPSIAWQGREAYDSSGITSLSWSGRAVYDNSGITSINWQGRELTNSLGRTVYSYELNLMYAFSGSQHAVIDVGGQILYDIADQSSIRWSTRDIYASDGSTVVANYTNSTGMRLGGSVGTGFSSGAFTPSARIHAHSLTGIATYQKTTNSTTGALSTDGFDVGISASGVAEIRQRENLALEIYTNNNLQATMSATGNFGIGVVPSAKLHIRAGTSAAGTAPLKYVSGALLTTPEVGAQEFLTDKYYATISTGTARKEFTLNDIALTAGRVPYTTTNGRMTNSANLTFDGFNLTQKGQINSITFVTGNYSVLTTDCYMFCPTGGAFTVTLPTAVGRSGQAYTVHNTATGVTTIATTSSQTINGALTVVLSTQYSSRTVVSDGFNWFITALV